MLFFGAVFETKEKNEDPKTNKESSFPSGRTGLSILPATKAIPKEMLAIIDRPLIQYAVDEAREAGIEQMKSVAARRRSSNIST